MEEITDGVNKMKIAETQKKNRIQVSNTKRPLFFYRYMENNDEVELSALGMAISTVVSIAEILKNNGFAVEKNVALEVNSKKKGRDKEIMLGITTSTVEIRDDSRGRTVQKAKIEIVLGKTANFDELMAAAKEGLENGDGED
ncbi:alba DNA/RNA-binding protein [Striga asiatica]|uniref:Alba DNA/RNA-binding protein n=1 Tax=Striga asiatica TaxID=4170 RepID=A0A5A7P3P9_STRAF|nr:alba DNA/RNA-binding protein [Striga asiatica]